MRQRFPSVRGASRDWTVVADEKGLRFEVLAGLIDDHIRSEEVLVEAQRNAGDLLTKNAALEFIATHVGKGEIRVADRDFSGCVVVAQNGVATGWTTGGRP